jgi:hypothetical protein
MEMISSELPRRKSNDSQSKCIFIASASHKATVERSRHTDRQKSRSGPAFDIYFGILFCMMLSAREKRVMGQALRSITFETRDEKAERTELSLTVVRKGGSFSLLFDFRENPVRAAINESTQARPNQGARQQKVCRRFVISTRNGFLASITPPSLVFTPHNDSALQFESWGRAVQYLSINAPQLLKACEIVQHEDCTTSALAIGAL